MISAFLTFWRRGTAQKLAVLGAASVLALCSCCSVAVVIAAANPSKPTADQTARATATSRPTVPAQPTNSPAATSSAQKLTATQKQQVSADLNGGLSHYVDTWHQGQQILGTTQYPNADAGLAAMSDPNSPAAQFAAWRKSSGIEQDVNTYINAFNSADAFYNADNEPQAITSYRDDMSTLQADLAQWVQDAAGWQIQTTSDAKMAQDVQTINTDISQAQTDILATLAAS